MTTLNKKIAHERKPQFDAQRIAAVDKMAAELCPIDETAEAMVDTLRMMNPAVREVIADEHVVIIEVGVTIREVDITGFGLTDLYTSLLAAVIAQ